MHYILIGSSLQLLIAVVRYKTHNKTKAKCNKIIFKKEHKVAENIYVSKLDILLVVYSMKGICNQRGNINQQIYILLKIEFEFFWILSF